MQPATKRDGFKYYECFLIFVDDILHVSHNPIPTLKTLLKIYELKDDNIGPPGRYIGANCAKYQLENGTMVWYMSTYDYVKSSVENVKEMLEKENLNLSINRQADRPYPEKYRLEIGISDGLGIELTNR